MALHDTPFIAFEYLILNMDAELKRYLAAILILSSLNAGFLATNLWHTAGATYVSFLIILSITGAIILGGTVWLLTGVIGR